MFEMSGIIKLARMCSIFVIFNIQTDTVVIQVAKIFTVIQAPHEKWFYRVVDQTSLSKEVVGWKVQFTISPWKKKNMDMRTGLKKKRMSTKSVAINVVQEGIWRRIDVESIHLTFQIPV